DLLTDEEIRSALALLSDMLRERLGRNHLSGRTVTLKVRFDDFTTLTRQRTADKSVDSRDEILQISEQLLTQLTRPLRPIRLLGLGVSGFEAQIDDPQLELPLDKPSS
ncbi:MAG: hypothetical protein R3301_05745, partial [Saprospiraceae bacterium]|nr:hypothetical protein [Saprospiraceae bacterium]